MASIFCSVCAMQKLLVLFMYFCIHDDILGTIPITNKKLQRLNFQIRSNLHVDKTGFLKPSHKYTYYCYSNQNYCLAIPCPEHN